MENLKQNYIIQERISGFDILVPQHMKPNDAYRDVRRKLRKGVIVEGDTIKDYKVHLVMNDGEGRSWVAVDIEEDSGTAKLDSYDYKIQAVSEKFHLIKVNVKGNMDVSIADIASDINAHDGHIYVEGRYFKLNSMETFREANYTTTLHIYATEER